MRTIVISTTLLLAGISFGQSNATPPVRADIEPTEKNFEAWRKHILPEHQELAWQQIPWLTTFKDGIVEADAKGKPLLFWTMNGHPLGCT